MKMELHEVSSESLGKELEMTPPLILVESKQYSNLWGDGGGWFCAYSGVVEACLIVAEAKSTSLP